MFGHAMSGVVWVVDRRTNSRGPRGTSELTAPVPIDEPAPTFTGKSGGQWVIRPPWTTDRPATTVCADPRLAPPGYRGGKAVMQAGYGQDERAFGEGSVKVTVEEAAVLQSFPPDYPWQGSRTKQFEQVGNAVPPRLAMHVLAAVLGLDVPTEEAAA